MMNRIRFSALFSMVSGCIMMILQPLSSQTISGCNLGQDQWQMLLLNEESGSKTLVFNYQQCNLDLRGYAFLKVEIENNGPVPLMADVSYDGPESWKHVEARNFIAPNSTHAANVILYREKPESSSPWMQEFGELRALPGNHIIHWKAFDLDKVRKVIVTLSWEELEGSGIVRVKTPSGSGEYTFPDIPFNDLPRPLVDEMGQLVNEDWDDKLETRDSLPVLGSEDTSLYNHAGFDPKFSKYGGWKNGPQFTATGRFYTTVYQDKWWLVDPEGYLFWSQGVTGVGKGVETLSSGRASLFPDFSDEKSSEIWPLLEEETRNGKIDFYTMNVKRKYGFGWDTIHAGVTQGRLKKWGLNTYGAWSLIPENIAHPYTLIIHPAKQGIGSIDKMVDPFSSSFLNSLRNSLSSLGDRSGDPWNIGIFINNELHWNGQNAIPDQVLTLSNSVPARLALEQFLEEKYTSILSLNASWLSSFSSFEDINGSGSENFSGNFRADMNAYLDLFSDTYYRTCKEEVESALPGTLYLGSRFHGNAFNNQVVTRTASRHCDVVSVNIYRYSVQDFALQMEEDKPIVIGEFHFGTGTHGVWGSGLQYASGLQNQADLYSRYITEALGNRSIVGAHWFQWSDQVVTGRKDGENYRIGLVDITDQPYGEMIDAIAATSNQLYESRSSEVVNIEELPSREKNEALIYPNPNNGRFIIRMSAEYKQAELSLIALNGSTVYSATIDNELELVLPSSIKGLHILHLNMGGVTCNRKLMIR